MAPTGRYWIEAFCDDLMSPHNQVMMPVTEG